MAADLARRGHAAEAPVTVMVALIAGTLITGVALYLLGVLKAGRWIRFVPYPVIAGFMAASGWLLASGGIRLATGTRLSLDLLKQLADGRHVIQFVTVIGFACHVPRQARRSSAGLSSPADRRCHRDVHVALHAAGYSLVRRARRRLVSQIFPPAPPTRTLALKSLPESILAPCSGRPAAMSRSLPLPP